MDGCVYCPYCGETLTAININEVEAGDSDGYIFVHREDRDHPDDFYGDVEIH